MDYLKEAGILYRHLDKGEVSQQGESEVTYSITYLSDEYQGYNRIAVVNAYGGYVLINHWNNMGKNKWLYEVKQIIHR